jgi:hypothetical protein
MTNFCGGVLLLDDAKMLVWRAGRILVGGTWLGTDSQLLRQNIGVP